MSHPPLISVVLPTRNRAHLIRAAVDSCLFQTYPHWELIVVNDGSTDDTEKVIGEYLAKDSRIKYIASHTCLKLPGALNRGFAAATGELLTWTSDDNLYEANCFQVFVQEFQRRPNIDFLYSDEWLIDSQGNILGRHTSLPPEYLIEVCVVGGSFMYRRRVREVIGDYATDLFLAEDYDYWLRIYFGGFRCERIDQVLYRYRKHPDALGSSRLDSVREMTERVRKKHLPPFKLFGLRVLRKLNQISGRASVPNRAQDAHDPNLSVSPKSKMASVYRGFLHKIFKESKRLQMMRSLTRLRHPILWGNLRRLRPVTNDFGYSRGGVIDRYYIERFLNEHRDKVQGTVLEIAENRYTRRFGGDAVDESDILHADQSNPNATIVGDLCEIATLPLERYDCIVLTQTLQFIFKVDQALVNLRKMLKPGGWLLITSHGISKTSPSDDALWGEYWRFSSKAMRSLMATHFPADEVHVRAYGNALSAVAFLMGMAVEDLSQNELDYQDSAFEVVVTCAVKRQ